MQYQVEILSHAMQGAAGGFLLLFAALSLSLLWGHRRRQRAAQESRNREHFATYQEPLPHAFTRAAGQSSSIPVLYSALCGSVAVAVTGFLALAYSPLTYFPNFQDFGKESKPGVELTTLRTDFESALMKVDGEVKNIGDSVLPELHVHLILYAQDLRPVAVHTIDIDRPLAPGQIMPFFFSEARSDAIRRVGVTFSSQFGPLPHREAAADATASTPPRSLTPPRKPRPQTPIYLLDRTLVVRGESRASHQGWRCARRPRRDEREYGLYLTEEQRRPTRGSANRMPRDFHHGLLGTHLSLQTGSSVAALERTTVGLLSPKSGGLQ